MTYNPNESLRIANTAARPTANEKNVLAISVTSFQHLVVHVVLDDDLHAEPHVIDAGHDEQQHGDRDERRAEDLHHRGVIAAEQRR